ncbi:MAG TPA: hypothetical protein VNL74_02070 [Methylococcus sp.]|nr:hypothetical protein [Methylococcus sp.]
MFHSRPTTRACLVSSFLAVGAVLADSTLEYRLSGETAPQAVLIKDDRVLIRSVSDGAKFDILFRGSDKVVFLIDHHQRSYTPVTERRIAELTSQAQQIQPLLRGFGEQIGQLSPKQKAKWAEMLGGVDLERLTARPKAQAPVRLIGVGAGKTPEGIVCNRLELRQGSEKKGEVCLAEPEALGLPKSDYDALRSLLAFSARVADQAKDVATRFVDIGPIPTVDLDDYPGVPVEFHSSSSRPEVFLTLSRIHTEPLSERALEIPTGYPSKSLTFW